MIAASALAGCSAPEALEEPVVRGLCAFPGLTYVKGDAREGKATVASLPLLSYYESQAKDGTASSRLCFLPLLASFGRETRSVRPVALALPEPRRPLCPDEDVSPDATRRGKIRVAPAGEGDDDDASPAPGPGRAGPSRPRRARSAPSRALQETEVIFERPAEHTEVDLLFPLLHVESESPGKVELARPGRAPSVVEVGRSADDVRVLPAFSYHRGPSSEGFVIWPLLASGYESDASGRYIRFFYFLKVRVGDPAVGRRS